jgi:hypothetical protein
MKEKVITVVLSLLLGGSGTYGFLQLWGDTSYEKGKYETLNKLNNDKLEAMVNYLELSYQYDSCIANCQ